MAGMVENKPTQNRLKRPKREIVPITVREQRGFWKYCRRASLAARDRAKTIGVPYAIDAYYIDQLLVDQGWKCAVSGLVLEEPRRSSKQNPLSPSLDRIVPELGYVPGNLRVVNNLVNTAMSDWGLDMFTTVALAIAKKAQPT